MLGINETIANKLQVNANQVQAAIELLEDGNTVPFIARYRKEKTNGLTDAHLRLLEKHYFYLKELQQRKEVILQSIEEQGRLTSSLKDKINNAETKTTLEDLYLPFRPKRKSKAENARLAGLSTLALGLLNEQDSSHYPHLAAAYLNPQKGIFSTVAAIEGAKHLLIEKFSEQAELIQALREHLSNKAILRATVLNENKDKDKKFKDYYDYKEAFNKIPSHRALALFRGRREGILSLKLELPENDDTPLTLLHHHLELKNASESIKEIAKTTWRIKLSTKLELELFLKLKEQAEEEAIAVFAKNLKDLLLSPPAGSVTTIGLDPGIRTGVKVAVIDNTGQLLDFTTLFPFAPQNDHHGSICELAKLALKYNVELISIGNGTGSRETTRLVDEMLKTYPDLNAKRVLVNEAGASVYSASELAEEEFPELDVTHRSAASIARRLQDPLAELVKIEPKAIGVGQYQHDVNQIKLAGSLDGVVEDCVNGVGVDLNTASAELLTNIAGLSKKIAKSLIECRNENGPFQSREELLNVKHLGEKSFQQAAGFLRIRKGNNQLDNTAIHPESYPLVHTIASKQGIETNELVNNKALLSSLDPRDFVSSEYGLPTIKDVLQELANPGREVRGSFKTATFKEGIEELEQLTVGMVLEGVVSNVANFGAFVDIGVHTDALLHRSQFLNRSKETLNTIKVGQVMTLRVIEVDVERKRIGVSQRLEQVSKAPLQRKKPPVNNKVAKKKQKPTAQKPKVQKPAKVFNTAMADALSKLKEKDPR